VRAFKDNYIWLLHRDGRALVVDPGEAAPVLEVLEELELSLEAILVTHHHWDHVGGIEALARRGVRVPGPAQESITGINEALQGGERLHFPGLGLDLEAWAVPGHTLGHLAYVGKWEGQPVVFCGDTLFGAGCGRLFEGSPAQMLASLQRLASLPADTAVFCAHEYTQANLKFAQTVEPDNAAVAARLAAVGDGLAQGRASVPFPLAVEWATNPFLRCAEASVRDRVEREVREQGEERGALADELAVFTALREWKNRF
jgi:hydroxyacylglutathione hydrolase